MISLARTAWRTFVLLVVWASCNASASDPGKVLRIAMIYAETGFDPATVNDVNSTAVIAGIMEPLLTFDYLARPARLVPLTAAALPETDDSGKTYTFRIKPGIAFASDPAFGGKRRELTAADYAYAIERLADPALRSPSAFHVAGKIVGLDARAASAARSPGGFDYDTPIEGLEVVDRHTLRIRLIRSDPTFAYVMALPATSAVAREVVEAYAGRVEAHPVGTGPYRLKSWARASKIVLEANPEFRGLAWNFDPGKDPEDAKVAAAMRGKQMPRIGVVEFHVFHEPQSSWLAFKDGNVDIAGVPAAFAPVAMRGDRLAPDLEKKGVHLSRFLDPAISYTAFNMRDPVVGGFAKEKVGLRRAIAMAYDNEAEFAVVRRGSAIGLQMMIPPGIAGHSAQFRSEVRHDPALANRLLDQLGYRRGPDGYRSLPDGGPLQIHYSSQRDANARDLGLLWKKAFDSIGVRLEVEPGYYPDQIKAAAACRYQMWTYGWFADYPDGDNFVQLLFGENIHQSNLACYSSPVYDSLYRQSRSMPDSPERTRLFERMSRQAEIDAPWRLHGTSYRISLAQPWVIGYKTHPFLYGDYLYLDVDVRRR